MQLTINDRPRSFAAPVYGLPGAVRLQETLISTVFRQQPEWQSHIMLVSDSNDENIHWPTLLWQMVILRANRPDLTLSLTTSFSSLSWYRLLTGLGISPGSDTQPYGISMQPSCQLTPIESRILLSLLDGAHVRHIAEQLHRNARTVSSHKRRAMRKVGLASNGELYSLGGLLYAGPHCQQRDELSVAEKRVLSCLLYSGTITEAARWLHRSIKTVSVQKQAIMKKLGTPHEVALHGLCHSGFFDQSSAPLSDRETLSRSDGK